MLSDIHLKQRYYMRVVIIGSGNVATVLGRLIKSRNHEILQVVSRTAANAKLLADELACRYADFSAPIDMNADLYLIAVNDSVLYDLNKLLTLPGKLVVHTAGSISKDVLENISNRYAILYPLQSLRKELANTNYAIPFLVDGNTDETTTAIETFARSISDHVRIAGDEERLKLHVAAVIVSNFTNHLYALAESYCTQENVDFSMLIPLITETANRVVHASPAIMQTGPAIRNDIFTLDKHLRLLSGYPKLKSLYLKFTDSIMNN